MPAGLPGATAVENAANPNQGRAIIFDLLSGPKGSPFDRDVQVPYNGMPGGAGFAASGNQSTGALATGIGFGSPPVIGPLSHPLFSNAEWGIRSAGFSDDYTVGVSPPAGAPTNSAIMYIGGGRSLADGTPNPYVSGYGVGLAGNGGSRDAGAGPAFTGFRMKTVTATGAVANGAAVEAGWTNRSGQALVADQSVFGSAVAATVAPS